MSRRAASSLAALALANRLVDTGATPLPSREFWALLDQVADPAGLLGADVASIQASTGFDASKAERIARLLSQSTALALELETLELRGFTVLSPFDDHYPRRLRRRLGSAAPPILYLAGPASLLADGGIGVVGSRNVSDAGAEVAANVARLAAEQRVPLVSGGAKGVDQSAMNAAYQAGGQVVGFLADSLFRRVAEPATRRAITAGRACLATAYKPTAGFSVAAAMGRNKLIYALADVTLVVAADAEKGGTWQGATEALGRGYGSLAVWNGEGAGSGNSALIERGGIAVTDPRDVFSITPEPTPARAQLGLGI